MNATMTTNTQDLPTEVIDKALAVLASLVQNYGGGTDAAALAVIRRELETR
jgi:hypothetical protein